MATPQHEPIRTQTDDIECPAEPQTLRTRQGDDPVRRKPVIPMQVVQKTKQWNQTFLKRKKKTKTIKVQKGVT